MRIYKLSFIAIICLLSLTLKAQTVVELDPIYPVHNLEESLLVIADSLDVFTPNQIITDSSLVYKKASDLPRYLEIGVTYWGKIKVKPTSPLENWTLQFEDRMIGPPAWTKSNGKVDVYAYADETLKFHKKTGVEYAENERDISANWVLNQISIEELPVNKITTLVIKAKGNSLGYPAYFNLSARSSEYKHYHQIYQFNNSFNIFMFGVTFIILLYHLLQYIYLKEKVFLWFSVWLLFCTLTHAMTIGIFIGALTSFRFEIWVIIANGVFYSFWFFGRSFINSKEKYPTLDKIMIGLPLLLIFEIIITTLIVAIYNIQPTYTNVGFHYWILNIYTILSIILSIALILKKDLLTRYFGVGSIIASLFLMLGTLWSMGILKPIQNFIDPFATGMFFQIIIYSFGIAFRQQIKSKKAHQERLIAQQTLDEMERIKDLDKIKTRFFANISHEFRTPLALIKGPLDQIEISQTEVESNVKMSKKVFRMISRNTDRLETLVDQLLDLSKIESGKEILTITRGNMIGFIRSIVFSFESMSEVRNISLNTSFPKEIDEAYYDEDKLEKIITNILSNAFKYTPKGGQISVSIEQMIDVLHIEVSDTGKGIHQKDLKKIFDHFYRIEGNEETGSGIGMALTKELVELHNGQISVDSTKNEGSTFKVRLPYSLNQLPKSSVLRPAKHVASTPINTLEELSIEDSTSVSIGDTSNNINKKPQILLVEDNKDLRSYIFDILTNKYIILTAKDGLQGERMAFEHIPDLIISDIMMPKKDGYELCRSLRSNLKTSHIPIIMLTAKADESHKIEGLSHGADAYLTKPFNYEELLIRVKNLIESRKKLWNHFQTLDMFLIKDLEVSSIDDTFLQSVFNFIKENIDNDKFSVDDIAREVGFSRSQLHRKLTALINKSANQLVIEIRMNEAHRKLEQKAGTVSEIAYSVGYSNLSYFSKSFKERFGVLPSKI